MTIKTNYLNELAIFHRKLVKLVIKMGSKVQLLVSIIFRMYRVQGLADWNEVEMIDLGGFVKSRIWIC
jgi:hypothetical protein